MNNTKICIFDPGRLRFGTLFGGVDFSDRVESSFLKMGKEPP